MTTSATLERLVDIESLLGAWSIRRSATKSELQSLVGKLSFVLECVSQSRFFLARTYALLRTVNGILVILVSLGSFEKILPGGCNSRKLTVVCLLSPHCLGERLTQYSSWMGIYKDELVFPQYFPIVFSVPRPCHLHADVNGTDVRHFLMALAILLTVRLWAHLWSV